MGGEVDIRSPECPQMTNLHISRERLNLTMATSTEASPDELMEHVGTTGRHLIDYRRTIKYNQ